jgi:hypothetical protein
MTNTFSEIREFIEYRAREGFDSVHEIIDDACKWAYEKYNRDDLLSAIKGLTAEVFAAYQDEQVEWGRKTDCDRLDEAFAALNRQGLVARQNLSCCNNCGFTEIWSEVERAEQEQPVIGYVFYHLQCTARAIKTGQLLMAYGSVDDEPEILKQVAETVVTELQRVGLNASWGGTENHPIAVEDVVWQRRYR